VVGDDVVERERRKKKNDTTREKKRKKISLNQAQGEVLRCKKIVWRA
jgi:hypothetical protein